MSSIVDSYSESNYDGFLDMSTAGQKGAAQSFTGDGTNLDSVKFYLQKSLSPTGNVNARVYAHSGAFGSTSIPTGSALATSDAFDVSTLTTSFALVTFNFSGAERITLTNGTKYVVTLEYAGSGGSNSVQVGADTSAPSHAGNFSYFTTVWNVFASFDACFYVYGVPASSSTPPRILGMSQAVSRASFY